MAYTTEHPKLLKTNFHFFKVFLYLVSLDLMANINSKLVFVYIEKIRTRSHVEFYRLLSAQRGASERRKLQNFFLQFSSHQNSCVHIHMKQAICQLDSVR